VRFGDLGAHHPARVVTMAILLRVRGPKGVVSVELRLEEHTLESFLLHVQSVAGVGEGCALSGYPLAPLHQSGLSSLRNGDTLVWKETQTSFSQAEAPPPVREEPAAPTPAAAHMPGGALLVQRVVPADNSCLFASISLCTTGSTDMARALRTLIAEAVLADEGLYSEAYLGRIPADYAAWVLQPDSWGGAIELSILAKHLAVRIDAADVDTQNVFRFGEDMSYTTRVLLLYDGLHYDAVTQSAFAGAPPEFDLRQFDLASVDDVAVSHAFSELVASRHALGQFTNTQNFTLRCTACRVGLSGESEAREHARSTGHQTFSEYRGS